MLDASSNIASNAPTPSAGVDINSPKTIHFNIDFNSTYEHAMRRRMIVSQKNTANHSP